MRDLIRTIGIRLFATEVSAALNEVDLPGFDLEAAKRMARQARAAIDTGELGYAIVCAVRE